MPSQKSNSKTVQKPASPQALRLIPAAMFGRRFLQITLWSIVGLLVLHLIGQYVVRVIGTDSVFLDELVWRFNVDLELNVPTWYSAFLAAAASLIAFFIAHYYRVTRASQAVINTWTFVAVVLLLLSLGEVASIHELILQTLHISADMGESASYGSNAWLFLLPFIAAGLVMGLMIIYEHLPRRLFWHLALAGATYLMGALVVEFASIPVSDETHLYNFILTPIEEGLEMLGLWLACRAILVHLNQTLPVKQIKLSPDKR